MPMNTTDTFDTSDLSARDRILLTAHDLFYRDGIRATGIDKVIAESKVAKMTFYRYFPSKNALISAFLQYRHQRWMDWFTETLAKYGAQPGGGLAPLLPTLAEWFRNPLYRGCAFINSVSELSALAEVVDISQSHKQDMTKVIAELLPPVPQRGQLAVAVAIAVDGAIVRAQFETQLTDHSETLAGLALLLDGVSLACSYHA